MSGASKQAEVSTGRSLAYVYAGYAFRYLYLLVLIPFYGRVLGPHAYGQLTAAMSLFQVVWMLVEWGLPIAGTRDVAAARAQGRLRQTYGQQLSARLWLVLPGIAMGGVMVAQSATLREVPLFAALAIANGLVAAFNMGWFFVGVLRFRTSVWLEVLGFAINLPLILWLVRGPDDAWVVMAVLLGSGSLCTVLAHLLARRELEPAAGPLLGGGLGLVRRCATLFVHKGLSMTMASATPLLMSQFATTAAVGLYGAADRLINVALSLLQPANQVLVGTVSSRLSTDDGRAHAWRLIRRGWMVMSVAGLAAAAITWLAAPLAVPLIFGNGFVDSVPQLQVLGLVLPLMASVQVLTGYVLIPHRHDASASLTTLVGAAVTLALVVVAGPHWGGAGVAWARVIGAATMLIMAWTQLHRHGLARQMKAHR